MVIEMHINENITYRELYLQECKGCVAYYVVSTAMKCMFERYLILCGTGDRRKVFERRSVSVIIRALTSVLVQYKLVHILVKGIESLPTANKQFYLRVFASLPYPFPAVF